ITTVPMERDLPYGGERFEIAWTLFGKHNSESLKIDVTAGDIVKEKNIQMSDLLLCPDTDETYAQFVGEAMQRNYLYLKLPEAKMMFKELLLWINELESFKS